eukprot:3597933-Pyramimonas_sp.AAC.2
MIIIINLKTALHAGGRKYSCSAYRRATFVCGVTDEHLGGVAHRYKASIHRENTVSIDWTNISAGRGWLRLRTCVPCCDKMRAIIAYTQALFCLKVATRVAGRPLPVRRALLPVRPVRLLRLPVPFLVALLLFAAPTLAAAPLLLPLALLLLLPVLLPVPVLVLSFAARRARGPAPLPFPRAFLPIPRAILRLLLLVLLVL